LNRKIDTRINIRDRDLLKKICENLIIGVRISTRDRDLINKICELRGEDLSDFVRRAIRKEFAALGFLSDEEKKALGVDQ